MKFKAVSHRLIFWVLGASASLFLAISYYEYSIADSFLRQQVQSKVQLAKSKMINRIDNLLNNVSKSVRTAAVILPIKEAGRGHIKSLLKTIVSQHQEIYGMTIALEPQWTRSGESGFAPYYYHGNNTIQYADLSSDSYDYLSQGWYTEAVKKGAPTWSEPYTDEGGGNVDMVTYSVPIYTNPAQKQELIGVITADITLEYLSQLVSSLGISEHGYAYVISSEGNIITHSNPEYVMSNISDLTVQPEHQKIRQAVIENMLLGETDTLRMPCSIKQHADQLYGDQCWISYQPITDSGWSIAIAVPVSEINRSLIQYRNNSLAITATGLLLLSLIIIFISRRITIPLLSLRDSSQALARGELDTDIRDFNLQDEVGTLARQFQRMQLSLKEHIEKLRQETSQRERLEGELGAAHNIQMQMLPDYGRSKIDVAHWQLSALLQPAKSVGGDFYHYQLLDDEKLFFAIGDVSDKGVAAALFMAKTQTLLRQLCTSIVRPNELLGVINQQLYKDNDSCMFVTVSCGVLDISSGDLTMANAGHSPPLLKARQCSVIDVANGPALGFFEDASFQCSEYVMPPKSTLILTTDGIEEATNPAKELYGEERLHGLINAAHETDNNELLEIILNDVVEFRLDAEPSDDLTIMTITRR
jgi:sigma-B regulation protein RsbU (phosphoserine phosphatase)